MLCLEFFVFDDVRSASTRYRARVRDAFRQRERVLAFLKAFELCLNILILGSLEHVIFLRIFFELQHELHLNHEKKLLRAEV